jgi:MFS family permease
VVKSTVERPGNIGTSDVPARRLIGLVCLSGATTTVSIGALPALLPEIGASAALADWQLGAVAGAFGLARMLTNVPAGLFITHHLARALVLSPWLVLLGAALLAWDGSFVVLLIGRALMGLGHTLVMLGNLTAMLRYRTGPGLASALNAVEFSAMLGVLTGATLLSLLPRAVPWNVALLISCAPVVANLFLMPALVRILPRAVGDGPRPWFARSQATSEDAALDEPPGGRSASLAVLAVAAGAAIAVAYSSVEQFAIPFRASREFGLDRAGIARLLMLAQTVDVVTLLPLGAVGDRRGVRVVLGSVLLVYAASLGLIGFGSLPVLALGCVLYGFSMSSWMLPISILRSVTPPSRIAWRAGLYRVSIDGGMFAGPFVSGLLMARHAGVLPGVMLVVTAAIGLALLLHPRLTRAH